MLVAKISSPPDFSGPPPAAAWVLIALVTAMAVLCAFAVREDFRQAVVVVTRVVRLLSAVSDVLAVRMLDEDELRARSERPAFRRS